jgi:hypothetical protein
MIPGPSIFEKLDYPEISTRPVLFISSVSLSYLPLPANNVRNHGTYPLVSLGVVLVKLYLHTEVCDGMVHQLIGIILCLYVIDDVLLFMSQESHTVFAARTSPFRKNRGGLDLSRCRDRGS